MYPLRFSKKCISILLVLALSLLPLVASASSLGALSDTFKQQKKCDNVMPSPAFLLGAEGVLASTDLALGDTLFDAYAYPLVESPSEFWQTYTLWLNSAGYTVEGPYTIDEFEAYALVDTSGLFAFFIPEFSTASLMLIPAGLTVGPLVLPDLSDYCNGSISSYDSRHFYSDDTWFFYRTSSFDFDAYINVLTSQYGFTYLGSSSNGDYHQYYHLVLRASQSETASYNTSDKCHLIIEDSIKHYDDISFCLPQGAVGITFSTKESAGYYTFTKGSTASYDTEVDSEQSSTTASSSTSSSSTTSNTKHTCSTCHGSRKKDCTKCSGNGKVTCTACSGKGGKYKTVSVPNYSGKSKTTSQKWENCYKCGGTGKQTCSTCSGLGHVSCTSCGGTGYQ